MYINLLYCYIKCLLNLVFDFHYLNMISQLHIINNMCSETSKHFLLLLFKIMYLPAVVIKKVKFCPMAKLMKKKNYFNAKQNKSFSASSIRPILSIRDREFLY